MSVEARARAAPSALATKRRRRSVLLLTSPALLVLGLALLIPILLLLVQSFVVSLGYGQLQYSFTLSNYAEALKDPVNRSIAIRTFSIAAVTASACIILGYPASFFITFRLRRAKNLALFLVVVSLFTSYLVRLYAWYTVLGRDGLINTALKTLHLIDRPISFLLFSKWAVLIAFVNVFLPFTILILASSMQSIPADLLENSRDLGASAVQSFTKVVLPLTTPGLVAAFAYTFVLTSGDYITPALLGGKQSTTLASIVRDQFVTFGNQPGGAALSFLMVLVFAAVYVAVSQTRRYKGV
ncbi:MAG: ABC transporter permease [Actinobacteria bacterium]|nr:MAG: ABC transporter permease [Actinomycetota bacterium]